MGNSVLNYISFAGYESERRYTELELQSMLNALVWLCLELRAVAQLGFWGGRTQNALASNPEGLL